MREAGRGRGGHRLRRGEGPKKKKTKRCGLAMRRAGGRGGGGSSEGFSSSLPTTTTVPTVSPHAAPPTPYSFLTAQVAHPRPRSSPHAAQTSQLPAYPRLAGDPFLSPLPFPPQTPGRAVAPAPFSHTHAHRARRRAHRRAAVPHTHPHIHIHQRASSREGDPNTHTCTGMRKPKKKNGGEAKTAHDRKVDTTKARKAGW